MKMVRFYIYIIFQLFFLTSFIYSQETSFPIVIADFVIDDSKCDICTCDEILSPNEEVNFLLLVKKVDAKDYTGNLKLILKKGEIEIWSMELPLTPFDKDNLTYFSFPFEVPSDFDGNGVKIFANFNITSNLGQSISFSYELSSLPKEHPITIIQYFVNHMPTQTTIFTPPGKYMGYIEIEEPKSFFTFLGCNTTIKAEEGQLNPLVIARSKNEGGGSGVKFQSINFEGGEIGIDAKVDQVILVSCNFTKQKSPLIISSLKTTIENSSFEFSQTGIEQRQGSLSITQSTFTGITSEDLSNNFSNGILMQRGTLSISYTTFQNIGKSGISLIGVDGEIISSNFFKINNPIEFTLGTILIQDSKIDSSFNENNQNKGIKSIKSNLSILNTYILNKENGIILDNSIGIISDVTINNIKDKGIEIKKGQYQINLTTIDNALNGIYIYDGIVDLRQISISQSREPKEDSVGVVFENGTLTLNTTHINHQGLGFICSGGKATISKLVLENSKEGNFLADNLCSFELSESTIQYSETSPGIEVSTYPKMEVLPYIHNNIIYKNGSGILLYSYAKIENNTIVDNKNASVILNFRYREPNLNAYIKNNIFYQKVGEVLQVIEGVSTPFELFIYNDFWNDSQSGTLTISNNERASLWLGLGNISVYPTFKDLPNIDFHLSNNSLCIDAGDPSTQTGPYDVGRVNLGRYGNTLEAEIFNPILKKKMPIAVLKTSANSVSSGTKVTLDGSSSYHPFGKKIYFTWLQIAGSQVTLTPQNTEQSIVSFQYDSNDSYDHKLIFQLQVYSFDNDNQKIVSYPVTGVITVTGNRQFPFPCSGYKISSRSSLDKLLILIPLFSIIILRRKEV